MERLRIGFIVNPIAGMGGRVGLKGTDGVVEQARARGATPHAPARAVEALTRLADLLSQEPEPVELRLLTCAGVMGADALRQAGFGDFDVVWQPGMPTTEADTRIAVERLLAAGVDLILFCGGDGTARDICSVAGARMPIVGIPAGVKMYSGVFGVSPARTAEAVIRFAHGRLALARADVADLDEERYRRGEWAVRRYFEALTPVEPSLTQSAKVVIGTATDAEEKVELAEYLAGMVGDDGETLFLLGPGSTMAAVAHALGLEPTLLGVDAIRGGRLIGRDLDETAILALLGGLTRAQLLLSPLGAQGFVLGRGNLQLSPRVLRVIGPKNLVIAATPSKLARTPVLRFDTGDAALDAELVGRGYVAVVTGHDRRRMVKASL